MKYQEVIILTAQRSGSHLLKDLLNSHPNFWLAGEPFSDRNILRASKDTDLIDYVDKFLIETKKTACQKSKGSTEMVVGFILHFHQIRDRKILSALESRDKLKFIVLFRRNQLARIVSKAVAMKRSVFTSLKTPSVNEIPPVGIERTVAEQAIKNTIRQYADLKKWLTNADKEWIQVDYEDICLSRDSSCQKVLEFFGMRVFELKTKLAKQNSKPLNIALKNYESVKEYLVAKGLERYL